MDGCHTLMRKCAYSQSQGTLKSFAVHYNATEKAEYVCILSFYRALFIITNTEKRKTW